MKIRLVLFSLLTMLLFHGCSASKIALDIKRDDSPFDLYGNDQQRNFRVSAAPIDSLQSLFDLDGYGTSISAAPLVYGGYVFCPDLAGRLYCFSLFTGKKAGVLKLKGSIAAAPVFADHCIIIPLSIPGANSSDVLIFDFINNKEIARKTIKGYITNNLLKCSDGVVSVTENGMVDKFSFSGESLFHKELKMFVHGSPALWEEKIFIPSDEGNVMVLNQKTGELVSVFEAGNSRLYGISINKSRLFVPSEIGCVFCMDVSTGKIFWQHNMDGAVRNSVSLDSAVAYIGTSKGSLWAVSIDSGKVLWDYKSDGIQSCPVVLTEENILSGNQNGNFVVLDKYSGKVISQYKFGNRVRTMPALYGNWVIVGFDYGEYRVFTRRK